ncbi:AAA family ATPase, partial [Candidatus Kaiserbacteria bacterium]|nr:AAA family ATPase [Candidatus Kaiserbacteria bacterium]
MTQDRALDILKTGANIFLTGEPGAGKTYVINKYVAWLEACGLNVAVTASTGIAATHIGGMTIHSWSGFGVRSELTMYDLDQIAGKERLVKRIKKTHVLVIDEISMLDGRGLDMVDQILKTVRQSAE